MRDSKAFQAGQLVYSISGRDKGKPYLVLAAAGEAGVMLVDGVNRSPDHPKKKNVKHLQATKTICKPMQEAVLAGRMPEAMGIRVFLKLYEHSCCCCSACPEQA